MDFLLLTERVASNSLTYPILDIVTGRFSRKISFSLGYRMYVFFLNNASLRKRNDVLSIPLFTIKLPLFLNQNCTYLDLILFLTIVIIVVMTMCLIISDYGISSAALVSEY
jgi:hypothetical protein